MSSLEDQFIDLVRNGTRSKLISFIKKQESKSKARIVDAAINEIWHLIHISRFPDACIEKADAEAEGKNNLLLRREFAKVAILGCSNFTQYDKYDGSCLLHGDQLLHAVEDLKPGWIDRWANHLLKRVPWRFWTVRALVLAGYASISSEEEYTMSFVAGGIRQEQLANNTAYSAEAVADNWERNPDIIDDLLWRIFEFEGGGDLSLAAVTGSWVWTDVLIELANRDETRREKFLDASLATLGRGFSQYRANWYSKLHESLSPTLDERCARVDTYMQLLTSNSANTVSFALKALKLLDTKAEINPNALIDHIRPAMQAKAKSNIKIAVKLIENAILKEPNLIPQALSILIDGFIHDAKDVHELLLKTIQLHESKLTDEHRTELQLYSDVIPQSLLGELETLTGVKTERIELPVTGAETLTAVAQDLTPLATFTDCIHLYLSLLEKPENPADIELLLEGLCRLSPTRRDDDRDLLSAVAKRANAIFTSTNKGSGSEDAVDQVQVHLASLAVALVQTWEATTKKELQAISLVRYCNRFCRPHFPHFSDIFHNRNEWILEVVKADKGLPLLSAPTNDDFYISGDALAKRLANYKQLGVKLNETDLTLALMRLDPNDRETIFHTLPKSKFNTQLIQDITDPPTRATFDLTSDFGAFDSTKPVKGVDYENYTAYVVDYFRHTNKFEEYAFEMAATLNTMRWYSTIWPTNNEAFLANALNQFDSAQILSNSPNKAYFEMMLRPSFVPHECGSVLLLTGLSSHDPSVQTLATDAFITAAQRDTLNIAMLGKYASDTYPHSTPIPRLTKALKEITDIEPALSAKVQQLISDTLRYDAGSPPRSVAGLIELLHELVLRDGVLFESTNSIDFLTRLKPSSAAGKAAGKLLGQLQKLAS